MKSLSIVIVTMVSVAIMSSWMLEEFYSVVPLNTRRLITAGGTVLSGLLAFLLSKQDVDRVDQIQKKK